MIEYSFDTESIFYYLSFFERVKYNHHLSFYQEYLSILESDTETIVITDYSRFYIKTFVPTHSRPIFVYIDGTLSFLVPPKTLSSFLFITDRELDIDWILNLSYQTIDLETIEKVEETVEEKVERKKEKKVLSFKKAIKKLGNKDFFFFFAIYKMSIPLEVKEEKSPAPIEFIVPEPKEIKEKFMFILTKDMDKEDIELLKEYGRVIIFNYKVYVNVPIDKLDFEYLILDIREREDRYYLQQLDPQLLESIHKISFCHSYEKFEEIHDEMGVQNIISKLPEKQAFKEDFNRLLLLKKIGKPRAILSCYKSFLRLVKGNWK
jgi:hypothetical protein